MMVTWAVECWAALKKNKLRMIRTMWANLKDFILSPRSQIQENLLSDFVYGKSTNKQNKSLVLDLEQWRHWGSGG